MRCSWVMIIFLHDAIGPMLMMLSCVKFLWCATRHLTFKSRQPAIQPRPIDIRCGHACGSKVRAYSRRLQNYTCRVAVARFQIRSISHQWQMQNSGRRDCVLWRCDDASMHRLWIRPRVSRQNQAAGKGRAHGFDSTGATLFRGAERRE